ncbi:MAG: phosphoenolpyruvate synthase [Firmicutes bacterium]|nr:phosphoenolpyruvate synthase [Bacillota bacterium]
MNSMIIGLSDIEDKDINLVGSKAHNLGKLTKIPIINVPGGFCVTVAAYREATAQSRVFQDLLCELDQLTPKQREQITHLSRRIREEILELEIPNSVRKEIEHQLDMLGPDQAFAVRSSSTAEDLPQASFAGQYDSFLNIRGIEAVLDHISRCWASAFSDRAVLYRIENGVEHNAALAVIVQNMVSPEVSGVLFTADPTSDSRETTAINAAFGLGEALVSGLVSPDTYCVREQQITKKVIGAKELAYYPAEAQGTVVKPSTASERKAQALTDAQILELADLGKTIEAHFGFPQDIEWCLANGVFYIVQSRPITALYPIPEMRGESKQVFVSVGHQQMMTDAMKPLGLSFYLLTTPAPMVTAGGRLFVDITPRLATEEGRQSLLSTLGASDPLMKDGLLTLFEHPDFRLPETSNQDADPSKATVRAPGVEDNSAPNPQTVPNLIAQHQVSIAALRKNISTKSGPELFRFIREDIKTLRSNLFQGMDVITAAMQASAWLNQKIADWLGEKNAADILAQGVEHNITSQMGLDLLDLADVIRPYPEIISYLEQTRESNFLDELRQFEGGNEVRQAILVFLEKYGVRCEGEIDITRPRWAENPRALIPIILSNIKNFEPGDGRKLLAEQRQRALNKINEILGRLQNLPDGEQKAAEAKLMIDTLRSYSGYREYPKYVMVTWYYIYKQALLQEAEKLVHEGLIEQPEDVYYLTFDEFEAAVVILELDVKIIEKRKREYRFFQRLTPPRIMISDGEIIAGKYNTENLPPNAIPGLAVSNGIVEGRARVILNLEDANLEEGDILVTTFTDPSWTPLFLSIKGLVTEVGGLMTHGSVIAREYGIPAVVGAVDAVKRIKDGQRIRVNGTEGYIELL